MTTRVIIGVAALIVAPGCIAPSGSSLGQVETGLAASARNTAPRGGSRRHFYRWI